MRIENKEFLRKSLRVQALAPDVPIQDAWAIRLEGGGDGRTLMDSQALLSFEQMQRVNPIVRQGVSVGPQATMMPLPVHPFVVCACDCRYRKQGRDS